MATRYVNVYRSSGTGITPPNVGDFWSSQGGYYIGNKTYGSDNYALILAPKNLFNAAINLRFITPINNFNYDIADVVLHEFDNIRNLTRDADDGETTTNNLLNLFKTKNILSHSGLLTEIDKIRNSNNGAFTDWYIPAMNESIEIIRNFNGSDGTYKTYAYDSNSYENYNPSILTVTGTYPLPPVKPLFANGTGSEAIFSNISSYPNLMSCTSVGWLWERKTSNNISIKEPYFFTTREYYTPQNTNISSYGASFDDGIIVQKIIRLIRKVKL